MKEVITFHREIDLYQQWLLSIIHQKMTTIRLILALVVKYSMKTKQMDVDSAFLSPIFRRRYT